MPSHESSIDVKVPLSVAFEEWTEYESFPHFMQDVHEVRSLGDGRLRWRGELGSRKREWESEVDEDLSGGRVAWRSVTGAQNDAEVTLVSGGDGTTRVQLRLVYDEDGVIEGTAAAAKAARARVEHDLRAFKKYAERRYADSER